MTKIKRKKSIALLIPVLIFAFIFVLITSETNFYNRFQYAAFPIIILSVYPLAKKFKDELSIPDLNSYDKSVRFGIKIIISLIIFLLFYHQINISKATYSEDGRYNIAKILKEYDENGYTIATTEAGLLPLYSGWRALDTWGLNDQWIAHSGGITIDYLDSYKPEIIMFHAFFSPLTIEMEIANDPYNKMTLLLKKYAEENKYTLAAAFGVSPFSAHYYYIKSNFKGSDEITKKIRQTNYGGAINFAKYTLKHAFQ
jgi:hypothetical protein